MSWELAKQKTPLTNREGTADAGNTAVLISRSVVGIQAGDILRVVDYLKTCSEADVGKIGAIGIDEMCIPLLHAAAFDHSINTITLIGSPISYRTIAMNRIYKIGLMPTGYTGVGLPYEVDFSSTIAGVLTAYDLPDLIGCMAPRKVVLVNLKDQTLESASSDLIKQEMTFPRSVYSYKGVSENLKILSSNEYSKDILNWCFK